jgi:hypothetical protein
VPAGVASAVVSPLPGTEPGGAAGAAGWGLAVLAATGVGLTVELMLPCSGSDCVGVGGVAVESAQLAVEASTLGGLEVALAHGVAAESDGVGKGVVVVGGVAAVGGGVVDAGALVVGGGVVVSVGLPVVGGGVLVAGAVDGGGVAVGGVAAGGVAAGGVAAGGVAAGGVADGGGWAAGQMFGVLVTDCCDGAHAACTTIGVAGAATDTLGASSIAACIKPRPTIAHIN